MKAKFAIILPDGAADEPVRALGGKTPLEAARTPNLDWIASHGMQGTVATVPAGFSPGSDVATLSLFGYDPRTDHPGRAPLEAAAQGIAAGPDDLIFRCNLVTITDGKMADFTAGHIPQPEAESIIATFNERLGGERFRFHSGVSYRNLLIARAAAPLVGQSASQGPLTCKPPHDIPDQPAAYHLPKGDGADWVNELMRRARDVLAIHPVNLDRRRHGKRAATDIWLWGQGQARKLQPFTERFGMRAAAIAAVDLIRGIAKTVGVQTIEVPGATGYIDTDYAAKGRAAAAALDAFDCVFVHVEAPDEAGHLGDAGEKVKAIEEVDRHVIGPVLEKLGRFKEWRILVAPDHPTPVEKRVHSAAPPPFCAMDSNLPLLSATGQAETQKAARFTEKHATCTGIHVEPGHQLLAQFLKAPFSIRDSAG